MLSVSESINFGQYLKEHHRLIYSNKGRSMLPLLREGRDMFIIEEKGAGRCRVGDVVLFRRGSDYVLHRVVEVKSEGYVILGDNCVNPERGVTDGDILGVMKGFVRKGREYSIEDKGYRLYVYVWMKTRGVRVLVKRVYQALKKLLKGRDV